MSKGTGVEVVAAGGGGGGFLSTPAGGDTESEAASAGATGIEAGHVGGGQGAHALLGCSEVRGLAEVDALGERHDNEVGGVVAGARARGMTVIEIKTDERRRQRERELEEAEMKRQEEERWGDDGRHGGEADGGLHERGGQQGGARARAGALCGEGFR